MERTNIYLTILFLNLFGLVAFGVELSEVIKKGEIGTSRFCRNQIGDKCLMRQLNARIYCKKYFVRLPTILELGSYLNPANVSKSKKYKFKEIFNQDGTVSFYYRNNNLVQDNNNFILWSDSILPNDFNKAYGLSSSGDMSVYHRRRMIHSVRCLVDNSK